jgi:hypothetical protein
MAKVKNVSGADRIIFNRLVVAGQVFEVADDEVYGLTCSANFEPHDKAAKDAHAAAEAEPVVEPEPDES